MQTIVEEECNAARAEMKLLREDVDEYKLRIETLEYDKEVLDEQAIALADVIEKKQDEIADLEKKNQDAQSELKSSENQFDNLKVSF